MGLWLQELKQNVGGDIIIHVVGTKSDVVAQDPSLRKVPFERCIAYVAENLYPAQASTPPNTAGVAAVGQSSESKRSSGFWGQDIGWDCCHEISAKDGEGIEEVFRVITRKLVEQKHKRTELEQALVAGTIPGTDAGQGGYFDRPLDGHGSFRLGPGDKRKSWLGFPTPSIGISGGDEGPAGNDGNREGKRGRCC